MESQGEAPRTVGRDEAAGTLVQIDEQHRFIAGRLGRHQWRYPVLGLVLGAAATSLMWRNVVWFFLVSVLFVASVLPLLGTPARLGVVPRGDGRGSRYLVYVGCLVLFTTPVVATAGPWWLSVAAGIFIAGFVTAFGRWQLAVHRSELGRPSPTGGTRWHRLVERLAPTALFVPVSAAVLAAATILLAADHIVVRGAALLGYLFGALFLQAVQLRIGELPPGSRPSRLWSAIPYAVLILTPQLVLQPSWPDARWPAIGCSVIVACTTVVVGRWQQPLLRAALLDRRPRRT